MCDVVEVVTDAKSEYDRDLQGDPKLARRSEARQVWEIFRVVSGVAHHLTVVEVRLMMKGSM